MKYATIAIAAVCIAMFILQSTFAGFTEATMLVPAHFSSWTIVTHIFVHADYLHIFYNLFALVMFGVILENIIGSKKILLLFFVAGLIAGLSAFIFYYDSSVLGASGAVMGIMGTLGVLRPRMVVWVMSAPMPMVAAVAVWAFIDLAGLISGGQGIANGAHLLGLATGIITGILLRKEYKTLRKKEQSSLNDKEIDEWENKWMK